MKMIYRIYISCFENFESSNYRNVEPLNVLYIVCYSSEVSTGLLLSKVISWNCPNPNISKSQISTVYEVPVMLSP